MDGWMDGRIEVSFDEEGKSIVTLTYPLILHTAYLHDHTDLTQCS